MHEGKGDGIKFSRMKMDALAPQSRIVMQRKVPPGCQAGALELVSLSLLGR